MPPAVGAYCLLNKSSECVTNAQCTVSIMGHKRCTCKQRFTASRGLCYGRKLCRCRCYPFKQSCDKFKKLSSTLQFLNLNALFCKIMFHLCLLLTYFSILGPDAKCWRSDQCLSGIPSITCDGARCGISR